MHRRPSAPTIYLPPIGVRLVEKYIGVDVRRQSLIVEKTPGRQQQTLDRILNQTGVNKTDNKYVTNASKETSKKVDFFVNRDENDTKEDSYKASEVREEKVKHDNDNISGTLPELTENHIGGNPFLQRNERPLDDSTMFKPADATQNDNAVFDPKDDGHEEEINSTVHDPDGLTEMLINNQDKIVIDTDYNLTERRSSRSTFRGRSSTRLPSQSNPLSEYNLGVIGNSKGKNNPKHFYLDYGDGKLHDSMEIPKVKDCSRPWCNPHCKTCRNRTFSRPCFVLIPAEENVRKRLIPLDKRRPSMFPKYLPTQSKAQTDDTQNPVENNEADVSLLKDASNKSETERKTKAKGMENSEITRDLNENEDGRKEENNNDVNDAIAEVNQSGHKSIEQPKKGYSKKRMNELAMPRGGPPAEVRFSKMSLRKKQEQLIEDERTKAFTEYERENLTKIQGKISVFLALLNQQELMGKPGKMVDIPVRMEAINRDIPKKKRFKGKRQRNVHFNTRPRLLS